MKKFIYDFTHQSWRVQVATIIGLLIFLSYCTCASAEVKREGNTFVQTSGASKGEPTATAYTYKTKDGKTYPIYLSANGRAYIMRVSRKGNEYKQYLPEDIARTICKELGVEYREKISK